MFKGEKKKLHMHEAYEAYGAYEAYDVSESVTVHRREAEKGSRELSSLAGFGVEPRSSPPFPIAKR